MGIVRRLLPDSRTKTPTSIILKRLTKTYSSSSRIISCADSNTWCKRTMRVEEAQASRTATSCRISGRKSAERRRLRRNLAANCCPLNRCLQRRTAAYFPLGTTIIIIHYNRNTAHVEFKNRSDSSNNMGNWNHLQIIHKSIQQQIGNHQIKNLQKIVILGTVHARTRTHTHTHTHRDVLL